MTSRAQQLLRDALELPVEDRANIAAELLASLDGEPADDQADIEAAWGREIEQRAERAISGESPGIAWEDVRARAEASLRQR